MPNLYQSILAPFFVFAFSLSNGAYVSGQTPVGSWCLVVDQSDDMDPWREWTIDVSVAHDSLTLVRLWQAGRYWQHDSLTVSMDGLVNTIPIRAGKWMDHVYLGVFVPENATRDVSATWSDDLHAITVIAHVPLETSQADTVVKITSDYRVDETGNRLHVTETRSSRKTGSLAYVFARQ